MSASTQVSILQHSRELERELVQQNRTQPSMVHHSISVVKVQSTASYTLSKDSDQQAVLNDLKSGILTCRRSSKNWNLVSR